MAEKNAPKSNEAAPVKKRLPLKTLLVLAAVLLVEAAAISAAFLLHGGPSSVKGDATIEDLAAVLEQPVEELVVQDKFQNTKSGRTFLYDTEIYIVIRRKHQKEVQEQLKAMSAQITTDIAMIFRRADPAHLLEPTLATITRQINAALDERLGVDEHGKSRVEQVLIRKCIQYRADL